MAPQGGLLHELFEAQAGRTPGAVALVGDGLMLTYAELRCRVRALAERLRALGVGPEVPVGVFLHRSVDLVVSQLAAFATGGVYVPLDPDYPAERLALMLEDSGCAVLLTRTEWLGRLPPGHGAEVVALDSLPPSAALSPARPPAPAAPVAGPGNLAYLIYTSGSTGRPKAVGVSHGAAAGHCSTMAGLFGMGPGDRILFFVSPSFDIAIEEVLPALISGAAVVVRGAEPWEPAELTRRIGELGLSIVDLPTAYWHAWVRELEKLSAPVPRPLRLVMVGGEAMSAPVALLWRRTELASVRLLNGYGPTEAVVTATMQEVGAWSGDGAAATVPIGDSLPGRSAWVLDEAGMPLPDGEPGELLLGGPLARGYLGHPDLTAGRFVPDPFSGAPGARLYRTGDLVRRLPGGELEFLGRVDGQVKIRGFRIETGEVEAALARHPGVEEAVVLTRPGAEGVQLAACVVPPAGEPPPAVAGLRSALLETLPVYMVPALWAFLDRLPLTPNGKVDRQALSRLQDAAFEAGDADGFVAPRTPLEERLAGIFSEVLGLARVGIRDDFFDLGGHSLSAAKVLSRVRQALGVEVDVRGLFERPTVEALAAGISELRAAAPPLVPQPRGEEAPLSFAQQSLWLHDRLWPGTALYNLPVLLRLAGPLSVSALRAALTEIVRRHEALRTVFRTAGDEPVQIVRPAGPFGLPVVDLRTLPEPALEAGRRIVEEAARPFELDRGPLVRAALFVLGESAHEFVVNTHHIVSDGWSVSLLLQELGALYRAFAAGSPSPLPELPVQYADYALWQRRWLTGEVVAPQLAFWRERLAGLPPALDLPVDRPRLPASSPRGAVERRVSPGDLLEALEQVGRARNATPFMALLAAVQALLHRYTGQDDLLVGSPAANRHRVEIEGLIGFFVNTLVLRTDLSGDPPFTALLARVRETALGAYSHQDLPFERLVEELAPDRDPSRPSLFQTMFAVQETLSPEAELGPGLALAAEEVHNGTAKWDLFLYFSRGGGGLSGSAEYSTDLFDASTVSRLLEHFETLLSGIVTDPETPVSDLPLLSGAERGQLLAEEGLVPSREGTIHGLFEEQALRAPEAVALIDGEARLTYAALSGRVRALADRLLALGVGPEVPVGIFLDRSADLVVSLLATLTAGGFYVPLDPNYPAERLAFMMEDSGCAVLLTEAHLADRLPVHSAVLLTLDAPAEPSSPSLPLPPVTARNLAYLIYTSGSTGRPKAVAIEHGSVALSARWAREVFTPAELSGVLASTSIAFDLSAFEIFVPLAWGGTVLLAENALALPGLPARDEVTLINTVPSALSELLRMEAVPRSVVTVNLAGEPLPRLLADRVYALPHVERLYNLYGPSEDTTYSTFVLVERKSRKAPPIGRPVHGTRAHVVDAGLAPVPAGIPGELLLGGGGGLARGYLGRPELTAERFVPDPWSGEPGARLYRTGDLARRRVDGTLEFLGRIDHQVKIRGFRIELGEIEDALCRLAGVQAAAVLAREDGARGLHLAAYVVPCSGEALSIAGLRDALKARLPDSMIPAAWAFLEALPLTPNGKVDRRALARTAAAPGAGEESGFVPPRTPFEEEVAGIWEGLLGVDQVGAHDNFFHLGGHSLLATRLIARMRKLFGVEIDLRGIFEAPTLEKLAAKVEALERQDLRAEAPPILPRRGEEPLPLSFAQQRLWFLDRFQPDTAAYNLPAPLRIRGPLSVSALAAALQEIVRRHEALRTTLAAGDDGRPEQVVAPSGPRPLPQADLSGLPGLARETESARLAHEEGVRPFDLARGPLARWALVRLGERDHRLLLTLHHIVSDGWSIGVLLKEIGALYDAFLRGVPSPLPELPIQVPDFALWQRGWLAGPVLEEQLAYWRGRLAGHPPALELPTDRPRPAVQSFRGAALPFKVPSALAAELDTLSRREGATLFMTLFAAFQVLLKRYTGQEDLLVGSPIANRNRVEIEGLIGFFVNTLVLRTDLSGDPTFVELLARVREAALGAYAHQDLPFEKLVEELAPERDLSRNPLVQVVLLLHNAPMPSLALGSGLTLESEDPPVDTSKFDVSLGLEEAGGELAGAAEYATDLFDGSTIRRMLGHFRGLLAAAVADPGARISELALLSPAERFQVLVEWNPASVPAARETVPRLVAARAAERPEAVAVAGSGAHLTYGELTARAGRLARRLRAAGVGPERVVGIFLERSAELAVGALAVFEAGGAYLPMDPLYPAERLAFMLEDSGAPVVLTRSGLLGSLPGGARAVPLDRPEEEWDLPQGEDGAPAEPENLAYVIYTSGSTGRPKGVAVQHASLARLVAWHREAYGVTSADRASLLAGPAFDASVWELWPYLAAGAQVLVPDEAVRLSPSRTVEWLREERVTLCFLPTPLAESALEQIQPGDLPDLRALLTGGDRLHRSGRSELPVPLFNHYGPTESTVVASCSRVVPDPGRDPSIGRPLPGLRVHLLDRWGAPVPAGVPGELAIGGAGLARGYVGRSDLTAERFVPDPFAALWKEPGARLYRTGDLARYLPGGEIEFLGRADHQVKVRGVRIELGEIESALGEIEDVREAAVLVRDDGRGARLVAYVASPAPLDAGKLRARLAERLPETLVPSAFVFLEALPLTPNGKVDRRALAAIEPPAAGGREEGLAVPRTPVEEVLAGIWSRVLGVERVGAQDDFFLLGGHSLLATQVLSRVRQALGVDLAVRALFEHRTLAGLARRIEEARREDQGIAGPPLVPREPGAASPASFSQARLWFLDRLQPGTALYNIPIPLFLEGPLRAAPLARALGEIVRRHEVLRTTFAAAGGEPVQVIHPFEPRGLPAIDLTALADGPRRDEARRLLAEDAARPFDLALGPLVRTALLKTGATEHVLSVSFHHIAADGWSVGVFLDELLALYRAFAAGQGSPLPELPLQFADFAAWQRLWLSGEALENQLRYWRGWSERFGGTVPVLDLPGDRPRPPVQTFRGAAEPIALSVDLSERLRSLARDRESTPFMTLLAGFQALLHRYTGQRHVLVGTPIANRNREEIEPLLGFFVNTLVLHAGLSRDLPAAGLLDRVREEALGAYAHQDLPFEKLVEELQPERDLSRTPLFQVAFALNAPMPARELAPGLSLEVGDAPLEISKVDLSISLADEPQGFRGAVEYSTDLFDAATVHRLAGHYRTLLEGLAAAPETALGELPLLTPEESQQILTDWNRTEADHGAADPVARFEALAAAWPEEPAVVAGEVSWSYGGLNRRANRLAWRLRRLGVGPEKIVAVFLERSPELCAAVLAVAKAGGAHLLLDPALPEERIGAVLADAGVRVVVTRQELAGRLPSGERDVLSLDADAGLLAAASATNPEPLGDPENLAYVIFTSGSTGRPKGVAIERRTLANLVAWHHRVWPVAPGDRASLLAGLAFDAVVWELWAFLTGGAALVIPEEEARLSPSRLAAWLTRARITHAFLPTPLAEALLAEPEAAALPLKVLLTGGDRLHRVARQDLAFPVANHYGPTESTVVTTFLPDTRLEPEDRDPSIGRPIDNLRVYLLDPGLRPVPVGVPGELYIAGAGLARGYLGQPDLAAGSFLPDPFGPPGARMYRSGDLARYRAGGDVEILGRIDHQVKIRGFRIELTEIELALTRHPAVRQAAVLVQEQGSAGRRLVAYLAAGSEPAGLKDLLRRSLPDYMVPGAFVLLPELPLTPNGKVDRKALLEIAPDLAASRKEHVAPRTPLEELVAEIWRDSLGAERVGVHDSFWDLGGHSLLATRVLARIEEEFGLDLPIQAIFEAPILEDFTAVLGRAALAELEELSAEEARALLS